MSRPLCYMSKLITTHIRYFKFAISDKDYIGLEGGATTGKGRRNLISIFVIIRKFVGL